MYVCVCIYAYIYRILCSSFFNSVDLLSACIFSVCRLIFYHFTAVRQFSFHSKGIKYKHIICIICSKS